MDPVFFQKPVIISLAYHKTRADFRRVAGVLQDIARERGADLTIGIELAPKAVEEIEAFERKERGPKGVYGFDRFFYSVRKFAMQTGFKVVPIDSYRLKRKSEEVLPRVQELEELTAGKSEAWKMSRPKIMEELRAKQHRLRLYMAVKRNKFMISRVRKLQPDIVITGAGHAIRIAEALGIKRAVTVCPQHLLLLHMDELKIAKRQEAEAAAEHLRRARKRLQRRKPGK